MNRLLWALGATSLLALTFFVETALGAISQSPFIGDEGWDVIRAVGLVTVLAIYRVKKKFRHEKPTGVLDFAERNWVELVIAGLLFPALVPIITAALRTLSVTG